MTGWLRRSPGITRAAALTLAIVAIGLTASRPGGVPVNWGIAIVYGVALAVSMRWPIIMAGTGARVVLMTGLLFEALWHHGLSTALTVLLVEFGVRMLVLYQGRYYWEWFRPLFVVVAFSASYGLQVLLSQGDAIRLHPAEMHLDTPAFVMVFAFWTCLSALWTLVITPRQGRSRMQELVRCLQQTWWVPLLFLLVAWPLEWIHTKGYPIEMIVCMLLVWVQSLVGPVFTIINQDRAITGLLRSVPKPAAHERMSAHRVMRTAHSIGRMLSLSPREMRMIGYAALLQEYWVPEGVGLPLWLADRTDGARLEQLRQYAGEIATRVDSDGALQEVGELIRCRYASFDGTGSPPIAGDAIPLATQVLIAANAITELTAGEREYRIESNARAVDWLRTHAASRFSPQVLWAASQVFGGTAPPVDVERGLPEAVRQLQALVGDEDRPSPLWIGLRRVWRQLWGQIGVAPDLPAEVQAMARLATYFASSAEADRTAQIIVEAVGQLIGAKVAVGVREKGQTELTVICRAAYGFNSLNPVGLRIDLFSGVLNRAVLNQEPIQVADIREIENGLAQEIASHEGIRSALFLPLVHRGQTTGLLFVCLQRQHWFTPREVGLIHLLAAQAAAALENAHLIREAEERLENITSLKAFTDSLIDNLSSSIIVVDPEGQVVMANAAARERFASRVPLTIGHRLPQELADAARVDRALSGEPSPETDVAWGHSILEIQSGPLKDSHGVMMGAICVARDVTQVRAMEQQVRRVEKLAAIGELAAGAAHEIRNPLTSIRGFIQLLQARAARAEGDYFQIVLNEIDRIDGIIRDMLLLARPSELARVETAIPAIVDELLLLHQSDLQRTNITVTKEFDPTVGHVLLDPKMFRQLLLNLILNAMQAMPFGGTLGLTLRREDADHVALQVTDTGVGISHENLKRLFVPFFTTKEEGTGLGLALCYSIVQAHGGKIDVQSQVGQGTTFTITLPNR